MARCDWKPIASSALGLTCLGCQIVGFAMASDALLFVSIGCGLMAALLGYPVILSRQSPLSTLAVVLSATSVLGWLILPNVRRVDEARIRVQTIERFKKIAIAFHEYHDGQKRLPPAALYSKDGRPLLSWRVLILPYLGHKDLFAQFKLDEPWDSPHNKGLLRFMPHLYEPHEQLAVAREPHTTFCQVFVGSGTAFEKVEGCQFSDFPDGISSTILFVEASKAVPWTKPEDLVYAADRPLPQLGAARRSTSFFFNVRNSFCIAWGDASIQSMLLKDQEAADESLRIGITRNDGRQIASKWFWP
jgi:hypothetical protein